MSNLVIASCRALSRLRLSSSQHALACIGSTRNTVWPANYIEAIPRKEVLEDLKEEGNLKDLAFCPVKAAPNDVSSSLFSDPTILKLEKIVMRKGKKDLARKLIFDTMAEIKRIQLGKYHAAPTEPEKELIELNPLIIVKEALENAKPVVIAKSIKRGGATYQVPYPITPKYSNFMSMNWMVTSVKERPEPRKELFAPCFAKELIAAYNNEGKVIKKKHDLHKLCEANKAYAHYRWG